jgi:transcription antitermination factor NusG
VTLALAERLAVTDEAPANDASHVGCSAVRHEGWSCIATDAQAERWASANLTRSGYRTYLPLITVRRRDRVLRTMWRQVEVPLFSGYLFVWLSRADPWHPIRTTPGVRSLSIAGQRLQFARPGEVEAIQGSEDVRRALVDDAPTWRPGDACRLADGAFAGADAVVVALRGSRAVVSLVCFGALRQAVVGLTALERRG